MLLASLTTVRRSIIGVICVLVASTASAPAHAATRTATDREAGVRFSLDDRVLSVRILRTAPRRVRRSLYGARITAACQRYRPIVRVTDARRWPSGDRSVRFRFRRDISRAVGWCLLENRRGDDIAFVSFAW